MIENFDLFTPPALNKHYRIDPSGNVEIFGFELNRSVAAANVMMWPALLCAAAHWSGRRLHAIALAIMLGVALATFGSNHETSKLSFVAGLSVFLLASFRPRAAALSLATLWIVIIIGILPASIVAHKYLELHNASWLQHSARQRMVIWNDVAERVFESPWFGSGARTAHVLSEKGVKALDQGATPKRAIARHAHNVYLQTWFELGVAGAMLLLISGVAVLLHMLRSFAAAQPYLLATFAVFMAEIGSSWEVWQRWFFALFVLAAVFVLLGLRSLALKPRWSGAPDEFR